MRLAPFVLEKPHCISLLHMVQVELKPQRCRQELPLLLNKSTAFVKLISYGEVRWMLDDVVFHVLTLDLGFNRRKEFCLPAV